MFLKVKENSSKPIDICQESLKVLKSVWKSLRDPQSLSVVYESLTYPLEVSQTKTFRHPNCLPWFSEVQKYRKVPFIMEKLPSTDAIKGGKNAVPRKVPSKVEKCHPRKSCYSIWKNCYLFQKSGKMPSNEDLLFNYEKILSV